MILLLSTISSFSQMKIVSFEKDNSVSYRNDSLKDGFVRPLALIIIRIHHDSFKTISAFNVSSNPRHDLVILDYGYDMIRAYVNAYYTQQLTITHPHYGRVDFVLPTFIEPLETYELNLLCINNDISFTGSVNFPIRVSIYDKNGIDVGVGQFGFDLGKPYIQARIGRSHEKTYYLKDSDKEEYYYMTTGHSKEEPLYVKRKSK